MKQKKYYTLTFLDGRTILETLTTKKPINRISAETARTLCKPRGADSVEIYESDRWGWREAGEIRIVNCKTNKK